MLRELRRVRIGWALALVAVMCVLTYGALALAAGGDDGAEPVVRATTVPAPTPDGKSVGGVEIRDGKAQFSGALKPAKKAAAAPKRPAAVPAPAPTAAAGGSLAKKVGQMVVSSVDGPTADAGLLARVRAGQVGGVILFAPNINTVTQVRSLVNALQQAARAGGNPPLLVMTDQEGGIVKRFLSAPPTMSAAAMSTAGVSVPRAQGQATAEAMRERGVNFNLAPVADVPSSASNFLGTRAFGRDAGQVARAACQFSGGLHAGGVASSLKHFPGLGLASGNTDDVAVSIPASGLTAGLAPYRQCANEPLSTVMVANAVYPGLSDGGPAVVSSSVYSLLRDQLGFRGVVISDSLNAAAVASTPQLAVRSARAGLDLLLWTSTAGAQQAYSQLLAAAQSGELSRRRVDASARRIRALKQQLGLV